MRRAANGNRDDLTNKDTGEALKRIATYNIDKWTNPVKSPLPLDWRSDALILEGSHTRMSKDKLGFRPINLPR